MEYDGIIQRDRAIAPTGKPEASTSHPHSRSFMRYAFVRNRGLLRLLHFLNPKESHSHEEIVPPYPSYRVGIRTIHDDRFRRRHQEILEEKRKPA